MLRICVDLAVLFLLLFAPFLLTAFVALLAVLFFPRWWEIIVLGVVADLIYGSGPFFMEDVTFAILPIVTMAAFAVFLLAEMLRSALRDIR